MFFLNLWTANRCRSSSGSKKKSVNFYLNYSKKKNVHYFQAYPHHWSRVLPLPSSIPRTHWPFPFFGHTKPPTGNPVTSRCTWTFVFIPIVQQYFSNTYGIFQLVIITKWYISTLGRIFFFSGFGFVVTQMKILYKDYIKIIYNIFYRSYLRKWIYGNFVYFV